MERYDIRADYNRLKDDCLKIKNIIENINLNNINRNLNLIKFIDIQNNLTHLSQMCKVQIINLGKVNPHVRLKACINLIPTAKLEYLDNPKSQDVPYVLLSATNILDVLIETLKIKSDKVVVEESLEGSDKTKTADNILYDKVNRILNQEKQELASRVIKNNTYNLFEGSISIKGFFKSESLKGLEYSVLRFPGVGFSGPSREAIPPVYIFHKQKLLITKPVALKVKFRKSPLTDEEKFKRETDKFNTLRALGLIEAAARYGTITDFTHRFESKYLMSKPFKGLRFNWLMPVAMEKDLGAIKEGSVSLMWE